MSQHQNKNKPEGQMPPPENQKPLVMARCIKEGDKLVITTDAEETVIWLHRVVCASKTLSVPAWSSLMLENGAMVKYFGEEVYEVAIGRRASMALLEAPQA